MTHSPMSQNRVRDALNSIDVHEEAGAYEFRADEGDHTPNEHEQAMLEDFGLGIVGKIEEALVAALTAPPASDVAGAKGEENYYAKQGVVWKSPITKDNGDGSQTISIGFPVCKMTDFVGEEAAETVAALMNAGAAPTAPAQAPPQAAEREGLAEVFTQRIHGRTVLEVADLVEERIARGELPGANFPSDWLPFLVRGLRAALAPSPNGTEASRGIGAIDETAIDAACLASWEVARTYIAANLRKGVDPGEFHDQRDDIKAVSRLEVVAAVEAYLAATPTPPVSPPDSSRDAERIAKAVRAEWEEHKKGSLPKEYEYGYEAALQHVIYAANKASSSPPDSTGQGDGSRDTRKHPGRYLKEALFACLEANTGDKSYGGVLVAPGKFAHLRFTIEDVTPATPSQADAQTQEGGR